MHQRSVHDISGNYKEDVHASVPSIDPGLIHVENQHGHHRVGPQPVDIGAVSEHGLGLGGCCKIVLLVCHDGECTSIISCGVNAHFQGGLVTH